MVNQDDVTLIIVWTFSWLAIVIMAMRLIWGRVQMGKLQLGDYLTMGAIFCAIARLAIIDVVLIWGSNNVTPEFRKTHHFSSTELYHREIGSKLTLVNRIFYNSYIWLQKLVLLAFYRGIIHNLPWEKITMRVYLAFFFGAYVVVQVITFTECNPFDHYWQVLPAPVAITVVRLPQNWNNATAQVNRTTWASAELLSSAIVANAPTFYSLNMKRREKNSSKHLGSGQYSSNHYPISDPSGRSKAQAQDDEFQLMSYDRDGKV
ncbi:hypothetical protein P7C71_g2286, partial [Lecanoromycetidae sp. Uapishka_2]